MIAPTRLVVATANPGKARELRALLTSTLDIVTAADVGLAIPSETGSTFEENARIKAVGVSRQVPHLVLSDDSGLEVAALDGRPGVRSARFAGPCADDAANIDRLLTELSAIATEDRTARFVCHLCLARSGEVLALVAGQLDGYIAAVPRGGAGFGYDPVFVTSDGRAMAELTAEEKNQMSHRGSALGKMIPILLRHAGEAAPPELLP